MFQNIDEGIVSLITTLGIGPVYLDYTPTGDAVSPPYFTYNPNLGTSPAARGDGGVTWYKCQFQVDLWMTVDGDSPAQVEAVRTALNGSTFYLADGRRVKTAHVSDSRIPEPQGDNLAHHTFTGEVTYAAQDRS